MTVRRFNNGDRVVVFGDLPAETGSGAHATVVYGNRQQNRRVTVALDYDVVIKAGTRFLIPLKDLGKRA